MWLARILMLLLIGATVFNLFTVYKFNELTRNTDEYLVRQNYLLKVQLEERGIEIEKLKRPKPPVEPEKEIDYRLLQWEDQPARFPEDNE